MGRPFVVLSTAAFISTASDLTGSGSDVVEFVADPIVAAGALEARASGAVAATLVTTFVLSSTGTGICASDTLAPQRNKTTNIRKRTTLETILLWPRI